jgi:hypothetical protein
MKSRGVGSPAAAVFAMIGGAAFQELGGHAAHRVLIAAFDRLLGSPFDDQHLFAFHRDSS